MPTFTYLHDGTPHTIRLEPHGDGFTADIDGRIYPLRAEPTPDGWRLVFPNGAALALVAADGATRHVWVEGEQTTLTLDLPARNERAARGGQGARGADKRVTAVMPGQVRAVLAAVGDSVTAGQALVLLEAMKMEIRASAPADGVVSAVHVRVGETVERGALLVELA